MKRIAVAVSGLMLVSSCQQTITANPTPLSIVPAPIANTIQDDLLAAENNLQQAMTIGALARERKQGIDIPVNGAEPPPMAKAA